MITICSCTNQIYNSCFKEIIVSPDYLYKFSKSMEYMLVINWITVRHTMLIKLRKVVEEKKTSPINSATNYDKRNFLITNCFIKSLSSYQN